MAALWASGFFGEQIQIVRASVGSVIPGKSGTADQHDSSASLSKHVCERPVQGSRQDLGGYAAIRFSCQAHSVSSSRRRAG